MNHFLTPVPFHPLDRSQMVWLFPSALLHCVCVHTMTLLTAGNMSSHKLHPPIDTLGPFALLTRLGAGGMAEVYLAERYGASGFVKRVAVKTLNAAHWDNAALQRLLLEEAKVGALFDHPNLVQVHELGVDRGRYYVCMDYVDGPNLATLTGRRPLSLGLALYIATEVAEALAYVHQLEDEAGRPLGLVHRDVSPTNVLVSRRGRVQLADFGIAKATLLADVTWGRFRKGKYAYMSPEQLDGADITHRSDQFALGVMLAELLTGQRPFDADTPVETMERICSPTVRPSLERVPRRTRRLLERCLAKSPTARFEDSSELIVALRRLRQRPRHSAAREDLQQAVAAWDDQTSTPARKHTDSLPIV